MTKFSDLALSPKILKAVEEAGYETPTPIQEGAIPAALQGRDVLGIAQTGTGKTAGFTLPMIHMLARGRARARMPRSLVLCPTRELAAQVAENFDTYSKNVKLTKALLIGGVSFKEQDTLIDRGVDVLIATPGRLLDHFERGKLLLTGIEIMVVDEADRMLDMGFIPDIERIFSLTPFTRQTLFFSATMAPEIERITNTFLSNPVRIEVARQATASETIAQEVVMFRASRRERSASEKRDFLRQLIEREGAACSNAIVFCNRKSDVDIVAKSLKKHGLDAAPIHGDLEQSQRTRTLDQFRDGGLRFLVASDVAARGLDIPAVSHVFNFDVPSHSEDYIHRIGRTGRAGRSGKAIMICSAPDVKLLDGIERLIGKEIPRADVAGIADTTSREDVQSTDEKPRRGRRRTEKPAPTPDAEIQASPEATAPPEATAEKPRRTRRRKSDDAPVETEVTKAAVTEVAAPEAPQPQAAAIDPAPNERDRDRDRGGRNRGRRNDGGDGQSKVVGMGDHMPGFIAMSFDERRTG
jgi:ATP-dependent RNA helicase RhlE